MPYPYKKTMAELKRIGEYEVGKLLGSGADAEVYLVRHHHDRGLVYAAKIAQLEPTGSTLDRANERLVKEMELQHDLFMDRPEYLHVVQHRGCGMQDGRFYILMEFFSQSLHDVLVDRLNQPSYTRHEIGDFVEKWLGTYGPLGEIRDLCLSDRDQARIDDVTRGLRIFNGVASALRVLHEDDIVHRDVKPDNILVTAQGEAKLCDYGVASEGSLEGAVRGTPLYFAPEHYKKVGVKSLGNLVLPMEEPGLIDKSQDIFALGVTMWEYFMHEHPFVPREEFEKKVQYLKPEGQLALVARRVKDVSWYKDLEERLKSGIPYAPSRLRKAILGSLQFKFTERYNISVVQGLINLALIHASGDNHSRTEEEVAADNVKANEPTLPMRASTLLEAARSQSREAALKYTKPPKPPEGHAENKPAATSMPEGPNETVNEWDEIALKPPSDPGVMDPQ